MTTQDDEHVFAHWTVSELQAYIRENSGNPFVGGDRQHLIAEAAKLSRRLEEQAFSSQSFQRPSPARPTEAVGPAASGAPSAGRVIGYPVQHGPYISPSAHLPAGAAVAEVGQQQPRIPGPRPWFQQPQPAPFAPSGRRKALLCGCNYRGSSNALQGCINDAHCMRHLLCTRFGFPPQAVTMLTDDAPVPAAWPTRANMLMHMQALVADARPGDSLVFHFSGHGMQVPDHTGDEDDGLNETLAPCDFRVAGLIVDDEINHILVNPLPRGVRLHAIIDACHSGTAMDLEFRCKVKSDGIQWRTEYSRRPTFYKGTSGGEVIQFGASRDKQTAADTNRLSGVSTGAATFSFIQAIEQWGTSICYGALLQNMTVMLDQLQQSPAVGNFGLGSLGASLGRMVNSALDFMGMSGQRPVMSANWPFDLGRPLAI